MRIRLTTSDTESVFKNLKLAHRNGTLGDTVQVHGSVVESKESVKQAKAVNAQFTLAVTDWAPGKDAMLPPLVPGETQEKKKEKPKDDGWF